MHDWVTKITQQYIKATNLHYLLLCILLYRLLLRRGLLYLLLLRLNLPLNLHQKTMPVLELDKGFFLN